MDDCDEALGEPRVFNWTWRMALQNVKSRHTESASGTYKAYSADPIPPPSIVPSGLIGPAGDGPAPICQLTLVRAVPGPLPPHPGANRRASLAGTARGSCSVGPYVHPPPDTPKLLPLCLTFSPSEARLW